MSSRCEAMVWTKIGRYVCCGRENADLHHKITRARGGILLDIVHETYHQMYLCREHHNVAHDEGQAFENGLLIRGSVTTHLDGKPLYCGPDEYLTEHYGELARV
jgi:hypothetical protein